MARHPTLARGRHPCYAPDMTTTTTILTWRASFLPGAVTHCADPDGFALRVRAIPSGAHWTVTDLTDGRQAFGEAPHPDAIDGARAAAEAAWAAMVTA